MRCALPLVLSFASLACTPAPEPTAPPEPPSPAAAPIEPAPEAAPRPHHYRGSIAVPGQGELAYFVKLTPHEGKDGYGGSIDIPQQGAKALALTDVSWSEEAVSFTLPVGISARWSATIDEDGDFECSFAQGPATLLCSLEEIDAARYAELREPARPQTPKPPFVYEVREVQYESGDVRLAGTLTVPEGDGPHPAVVLITGSGAQDRDETVMGHKPFWVWADHLSRHGVAVLRSDDRGVGGSTGSVKDSTADDSAADALAAVGFLATQPDINKGRIGLMGHSEGGAVAPLAARRSKDVAFIVLLAAPGLPGKEVIARQAADIARVAGADEADITRAQEQRERLWTMIEAGGDEEELRAKLEAFLIEDMKKMAPDGQVDEATIEQAAKLEAMRTSTRWFRDFLNRDPRKILRRVTVPVLAVTGEKDLQVAPEENLPAIEKALKKAGNKDVTVETLPGLNHLLQKAETGLPGEYATIEETVSPAALERVTTWIRTHTGLGTE